MNTINYRKYWCIIIALTSIVALAFQGSRGLWEPDEGRYVRCAYEMLKSGDWITPRLNGSPHFAKPPLTYWLIASGMSLLGANEWGARFFHAIFFILTTLATGYVAARMWNQTVGLLSSLVFSTMAFTSVAANIATTDMILTFFITGAMVCLWMSTSCSDRIYPRNFLWWSLMCLFIGLGFLTKGPPGLLPLPVTIAYLVLSEKAQKPSAAVIVAGCGLFCAVAFPWYLVVIQHNDGLLSYFISEEIVGRIITGQHTRNAGFWGAFKIYPHTLLLGSLPWSCFLFIWMWKTKQCIWAMQWWKRVRSRDNKLFILLWFMVPLLILTISNSRLPLYVLPLFVPFALAIARILAVHYSEKVSTLFALRGKPAVLVVLLIGIVVGSRGLSAYFEPKMDSRAIWKKISVIIKERIGDSPYNLSVVGLQLHGIAFYSGKMINTFEIKKSQGHSFSRKINIVQEMDNLLLQPEVQVLLTRRKFITSIITQFREKGIRYEIQEGPYDYTLIFCRPVLPENAVKLRAPSNNDNL